LKERKNFIKSTDTHLAILQAMVPPVDGIPPPLTPLLAALITPPSSPLNSSSVSTVQFAALLFAHLLKNSAEAKTICRRIIPPIAEHTGMAKGDFFVPADMSASGTSLPPQEAKEEDEPQTLLQILSEHLALAFLSRSRASTEDGEHRLWDRLVCGYLCLLSEWVWDDPASVRDFLEAGALGMVCFLIPHTGKRKS
jgi:intracellular protein transport protein USO1